MKAKRRISREDLNPAQVLVLGFAGMILLGAILLNLPISSADYKSIGFVDSLFTATSAVCVTGLVVVDTGTHWTMFGKMVILLLIQAGGLGFMTLATTVAFVIGKKITLRSRMIMQEALNQFTISGVVRLTKYIIFMTLAIEGVGAFLLAIKFIPTYGVKTGIFYGIFHSISAFCNAGFDIIGNGQSLMPFAEAVSINFIIMALIIVGGIGFTVIIDVTQNRKYKKFSTHTKLVLTTTAGLIIGGFILFFLLEFNNPNTLGGLSLKGKFLGALFQSVTTRTAGFNSIPLDQMTISSKFVTVLFMFIGGSPGSTAGGVKTTTIALVVLLVISVIKGRDDVEFQKRRISKESVQRALTVLAIAFFFLLSITLLLTVTEQSENLIEMLFETTSAIATVGLSLGITSKLSVLGRLIIIIAMFIGRLGPVTIVLALANRQNAHKNLIRYPEGKVSVG